jgi:hypothetical protein
MIPLSPPPTALTWSTIAHHRGYELKLSDKVVGTLRHPAVLSSCFLAETQQGNWTFRRGGLLGASATVVDSLSQQPIATFKAAWGCGGALTFSDGQTFHLECNGWTHPVWSVITGTGELVLALHVREKTVEVPAFIENPDGRLALLIMFTLYRVQQAEEDAASAAMVA